jgi:hypothetical protein
MAIQDGGSDNRKFTDGEMRLIFERAGEADVGRQGDRVHSLGEMQEIARQVGLDPADVARAAATIGSPRESHPVLGEPIRFHASRVLPSKVSDDGVMTVVLKIREATGLHGVLREVPGGAEWRVRSALGTIVVDFIARGAGTRIDLMVARDDEVAVTVIGVGVAGLLTGVAAAVAVSRGLHVGAFAGVGIGAATAIGGAWAGIRALWSRAARRWARKTDALIQTIGDAAEQSTSDPIGD